MLEQTIGFLGAGKMAEALARGLLDRKLAPPGRILLSDVDPARRAHVAGELGVRVVEANSEMIEGADIVVVALKPGVVRQVLPGLAAAITPGKLVVSIAAGITLAELEAALAGGTRVVRVMPNTPCLVGEGASAFALGSSASEADGELVAQILGSVGLCLRLPEAMLDAVTGLSGSGPAFVAVVVDALADGGVLCGLKRDDALRLAAQTVLGAARFLLATGKHPGELKDMVASPGGTTIAGLRALEAGGLRAALIAAVGAAAKRSEELGRR